MEASDLILWKTQRPKEPNSEAAESSERSRSEQQQQQQQQQQWKEPSQKLEEPEQEQERQQELPHRAVSSSSSSPKDARSPTSATPPSLVSMDPLSMLRHQRKQGGSGPGSNATKPSTSVATPPLPLQGKSTVGTSEAHKGNPLFDVESSLGMYSSSRNGPSGGDVVGENAETAMRRIECALAPGSNVDFPTITDIGDRIAHVPAEMGEAVALLARTFSSSRAHPRRRLKALTITNELAYDPFIVKELRRIPSVRSALHELRAIRGTELGEAAEEQIRMFATELSRKCEDDDGEGLDTSLSPSNRSGDAFDMKAFGNGVKVYASGLFAAAVDGFSDAVGKMQEQTFAAAPFLAAAADGCSAGGVTSAQGGIMRDEVGIPRRRDLPGGPLDASFPISATEHPRTAPTSETSPLFS